jgi:hypothetical protein
MQYRSIAPATAIVAGFPLQHATIIPMKPATNWWLDKSLMDKLVLKRARSHLQRVYHPQSVHQLTTYSRNSAPQDIVETVF